MTVEELIDALREMPPSATVLVDSETPVAGVEEAAGFVVLITADDDG
jgi:hypothetical protein